jgi:hypothetical protein
MPPNSKAHLLLLIKSSIPASRQLILDMFSGVGNESEQLNWFSDMISEKAILKFMEDSRSEIFPPICWRGYETLFTLFIEKLSVTNKDLSGRKGIYYLVSSIESGKLTYIFLQIKLLIFGSPAVSAVKKWWIAFCLWVEKSEMTHLQMRQQLFQFPWQREIRGAINQIVSNVLIEMIALSKLLFRDSL